MSNETGMRTRAMVVIRHDVDADTIDEYLRWHSFEHLPERLALPGFRRAERWELLAGVGPRFLCVIDVDSPRDLESPEYCARLDAPTEWTRRLMPHYRHVQRALCETLVDGGAGIAPFAWCLRFDLRDGAWDTHGAAIERVIHEASEGASLTRIRLGRVHDRLTGRQSEEKRIRGTEDTGGFGYFLLAGGLTMASVERGATALEDALEPHAGARDHAFFTFSYASGA